MLSNFWWIVYAIFLNDCHFDKQKYKNINQYWCFNSFRLFSEKSHEIHLDHETINGIRVYVEHELDNDFIQF